MNIRNLSGWLIRGTMILAFVALVVLGFSRFLSLRARLAAAKPPLPAARTIEARSPAQGTVLRTIPAIATVESHASIRVPVQMAGRLVSLSRREGDRVKAGDELARIDPDEPSVQKGAADAQVAAAGGQLESVKAALAALVSQREALQANLAFQKSEEARDRALFEGGAISQSQWDAAKNRRIDAESRLKALDEQIRSSRAQQETVGAQQQAARKSADLWKIRQDYSLLRAPVDGVITARLQEEGQFVMPGAPVYVLEDTRETRLRLQIPQNRASELALGQPVCLSNEEFAFQCLETGAGNASSTETSLFRLDRIHPQVNEFRQVVAEAVASAEAPALLVGRQLPARVVVRQTSGLAMEAGMLFPDLASPGAWVGYEITGGMANRRAIVPEMIGDDGRAIVSPAQVRSDAQFLVAPYLAHVRLPASFPVEVTP